MVSAGTDRVWRSPGRYPTPPRNRSSLAGSVVLNGFAPQGSALQQDSPKFANSKTGSLSVEWSSFDLPDAEITVHSPVSLSPWVRFWRCIPPANRQDAPTHIVDYQGTNPDSCTMKSVRLVDGKRQLCNKLSSSLAFPGRKLFGRSYALLRF